jgi:hypothetical protein
MHDRSDIDQRDFLGYALEKVISMGLSSKENSNYTLLAHLALVFRRQTLWEGDSQKFLH